MQYCYPDWSCRILFNSYKWIKNLPVKVRWLRSVPIESTEKNWCTIFHELKWRSLRIICRFLKEELQSIQVKIPFMNWLFEKWICLLLLYLNLYSVSNCIQMIGEFLTTIFKYMMRWKIFQWIKFRFRLILQIRENSAGRNFITNSRVYSLFIVQAKMQTEINNN